MTDAGQTGRILNINENHSQYGILKRAFAVTFFCCTSALGGRAPVKKGGLSLGLCRGLD